MVFIDLHGCKPPPKKKFINPRIILKKLKALALNYDLLAAYKLKEHKCEFILEFSTIFLITWLLEIQKQFHFLKIPVMKFPELIFPMLVPTLPSTRFNLNYVIPCISEAILWVLQSPHYPLISIIMRQLRLGSAMVSACFNFSVFYCQLWRLNLTRNHMGCNVCVT